MDPAARFPPRPWASIAAGRAERNGGGMPSVPGVCALLTEALRAPHGSPITPRAASAEASSSISPLCAPPAGPQPPVLGSWTGREPRLPSARTAATVFDLRLQAASPATNVTVHFVLLSFLCVTSPSSHPHPMGGCISTTRKELLSVLGQGPLPQLSH